MSTFSSDSNEKKDVDQSLLPARRLRELGRLEQVARYARQVAETIDQVRHRVRTALAQVRTWWDQRSIRTTTAALPNDPQGVVTVLRHEDAALQRRGQVLRVTEQAHQAEAQRTAHQRAELERQVAAEAALVAAHRVTAGARATAERQVAAQMKTVALETAAAASVQLVAATSAVTTAETLSAPGRARVSRVEKQARKDATPAQAAATKATATRRTEMIVDEATYPIAWVAELEIAGVRMPPPGQFAQAVAMPSPHSRVVGGMGRFDAQVDWAHPKAGALAASILDAQRIPSSKRGGQVKHVAHAVLSKPNDGKQAVQQWTSDTAMRAARHYLVGHGVEPDRHDVVVFVHSQVGKRNNGSTKVEEAVHILWSRVRDDGMLHHLDHAFVADALSRARYDVYAGIDPARIGMSSTKSHPVREGLKALSARELAARYVDPRTRRTVELVPLQEKAHAQRLGAEGHPDTGDIAGTWTTKPCYRTEKSIRDILKHLMEGD